MVQTGLLAPIFEMTLPDTLPSVSWTPEPVSSAFHFPWSLKAFSLVPPTSVGPSGKHTTY